jgi:hypothetical protein
VRDGLLTRSEGSGFPSSSGCRLDQLPLCDGSPSDCAGVYFPAAFRQQGASGGHRFVQGDRRQGHIGIAGVHEVSRWPSNEDASKFFEPLVPVGGLQMPCVLAPDLSERAAIDAIRCVAPMM